MKRIWPWRRKRVFARDRLLDLDDEVAAKRLFMGVDQLRARRGVIVVGVTGIDARAPLDDDLMAVLDELIHGGRQQPDAVLLRFDFLGDADDHI